MGTFGGLEFLSMQVSIEQLQLIFRCDLTLIPVSGSTTLLRAIVQDYDTLDVLCRKFFFPTAQQKLVYAVTASTGLTVYGRLS